MCLICCSTFGFTRFDSVRGCLQDGPEEVVGHIDVRERAGGGGGWSGWGGGGSGGGSYLAPAILGDASCQRSTRHFSPVNHGSCRI